MKDIKLSACVPTYNRAKFLKCTIESLLNQSEPIDEIVVIDDGSTDNTREIVESYEAHGRVIYYGFERDKSQPRNLTMVNALNFCIDKATGDYISIVGDDDLVSFDWSKTIKNSIRAKKKAKFYFFSYSVIDTKNKILRKWKQKNKKGILCGLDIFLKTNMLFGVYGNLVSNRNFLIEIGKFSTEFGTFFDKEFFCHIAYLKAPIFFSNDYIFYSRTHKGQMSHTLLHGDQDMEKVLNSFFSNSEFICKINKKYKDFLFINDPYLKSSNSKNILGLFKKLLNNSFFLREISFLYSQGLWRNFFYKNGAINKRNCSIIKQYFSQINSSVFKFFLLLYFLRYWIGVVNLSPYFKALLNGSRDPNLRIKLN